MSSYLIALIGKFMCYAMAALALDLIWGYAGILSLGHGLFFALGGYAQGMYLMRAGKATPDIVPDFMTFLSWKSYPWFWSFTEHFWYAMLLVVLVPGYPSQKINEVRLVISKTPAPDPKVIQPTPPL